MNLQCFRVIPIVTVNQFTFNRRKERFSSGIVITLSGQSGQIVLCRLWLSLVGFAPCGCFESAESFFLLADFVGERD